MSTLDQEEYGTSLEDQTLKGQLMAQLHDYRVASEHIYSGDESGTLPLAQRPIMQRVLADARAHAFDAVCFHKIDRIARRLKYILEIWDALEKAGVAVLIIDPGIDTGTAIGRAMRNILGTIAELEADTILERTMGGRRRKLARGELFLPAGKYGYHYQLMDRVQHIPGRVTIDEAEAAVVRRIYRRRAQGVSFERIAAELTADGLPSPGGKAHWMYTTIRRLVRDPAYKGEGLWGVEQAVQSERSGKRVCRPRRDGRTPIRLAYPPIVAHVLWQEAQGAGAQGTGRACMARASVEKFLLRGGVVRCAAHDRTMTGSSGSPSTQQYRCTRTLPTAKRGTHSVPSRALDAAVWDEVVGFLLDPTRGLAAARARAQQAEQRLAQTAQRRSEIDARLTALAEQSAYLLRLARETAIAPQMIEASLTEVANEQEALRLEMLRLDAQVALAQAALPQAAQLAATCRKFATGAATASPHKRRAILEELEVAVHMTGMDYTITGVVPELERHGTLHGPALPNRASTDAATVRFVLTGTLARSAA